jgi:alpha-amylase
LEEYAPATLETFKKLVATGRVEVLGETYYHSLAFYYSLSEFEEQVKMQNKTIKRIFGVTPKVFSNTELAYRNDLAQWAERLATKALSQKDGIRYSAGEHQTLSTSLLEQKK